MNSHFSDSPCRSPDTRQRLTMRQLAGDLFNGTGHRSGFALTSLIVIRAPASAAVAQRQIKTADAREASAGGSGTARTAVMLSAIPLFEAVGALGGNAIGAAIRGIREYRTEYCGTEEQTVRGTLIETTCGLASAGLMSTLSRQLLRWPQDHSSSTRRLDNWGLSLLRARPRSRRGQCRSQRGMGQTKVGHCRPRGSGNAPDREPVTREGERPGYAIHRRTQRAAQSKVVRQNEEVVGGAVALSDTES